MNNYLPTLYQQFIHKSRYARWLWDENRRETWDETVARYFDFFEEHLSENNNFILDEDARKELEESLDVSLPDSAEVASALEFSKETYSEAHKIKSLSKQNSEIWETS